MPQWVNFQLFDSFIFFVENKQFKSIDISDEQIKRLLWLSDYLQIDILQKHVIKDIIMNKLNGENCLVYLNESFKKLKVCQNSDDLWYGLMNQTIKYSAYNVEHIIGQKYLDKINHKICEEIFERALRYHQNMSPQLKEQILMKYHQVKKVERFDQLLQVHKQIVKKKQINDNYSNISWKISSINSLVNQDQTKHIKFQNHNWKFSTQISQNNLTISLRFLDNLNKFVCVLYRIKIENQNQLVTEKPFNMKLGFLNSQYLIDVCEFNQQQIQQLSQQNGPLEITIYIFFDNLYSNILQIISQKILNEQFHSKMNLTYFDMSDLAFLHKINMQMLQGQQPEMKVNYYNIYLFVFLKWLIVNSQNSIDLFQFINFNKIYFSNLILCLSMKIFGDLQMIKIFLEKQLNNCIQCQNPNQQEHKRWFQSIFKENQYEVDNQTLQQYELNLETGIYIQEKNSIYNSQISSYKNRDEQSEIFKEVNESMNSKGQLDYNHLLNQNSLQSTGQKQGYQSKNNYSYQNPPSQNQSKQIQSMYDKNTQFQKQQYKSIPNRFYTQIENLSNLSLFSQKKCIIFQKIDVRNFVKPGSNSFEMLKDLRFQDIIQKKC